MSQRKLRSSLKVIPTIPNLRMGDKWSAMIPGAIDHIKRQDVQGITLMEPYITSDTNLNFDEGKMSKLEAITDRLNACIDYFVDKTDATHMWLIDSDVEVPRHALRYLLNLDVDIASGIYPFHNKEAYDKYCFMFGKMRDPNADAAEQEKTNKFVPRGLIGFSGDGVIGRDIRVGGGNGCMLMKRRVFKQWHPQLPSLRFMNNYKDMGSDLFFWHRAQNAGLTCRVHGRVICGHRPQWPLEVYAEDYEKYGLGKEWK